MIMQEITVPSQACLDHMSTHRIRVRSAPLKFSGWDIILPEMQDVEGAKRALVGGMKTTQL